MTNDHYMDIDHEHSSSLPSSDLLEAARFHIPPPTNPELQRLREIGTSGYSNLIIAPGTSNSNQDASRSVNFRSLSIRRVRQMGDPYHPARGRAASIRSTADVTPSVAAAQDDFKHLMFDLRRSMKHRSDRVAAKSSGGASLHDKSRPVDGDVSKLSRLKPPCVGPEHTIAAPFPHSTVPARSHRSRLKHNTANSRDATCVEHSMDQDDSSVAGSSRPVAHAILMSQISDPEYDFPSSTPTPPPKERSRVSSSSQRSSEDSSSSLLSLRQWRTSYRDMPSARTIDSPIDSRDNSSSMDQDLSTAYSPATSSEPMPVLRAPSHISKPSTCPPASSATFMLPPANPVARQSFNIASSMSTPSLPSNMTQHPPPLGMVRRNAQSARFRTNKKPFKVPFAVKKETVLLRHATVSGVKYSDPARTNAVMEGARRSLSPAVPDPPYIVKRGRAEQSHTQPSLEMTARRPEPVPLGEDKDAEKDANSSADLWANVPSLDDIGDVP